MLAGCDEQFASATSASAATVHDNPRFSRTARPNPALQNRVRRNAIGTAK
jgi:hypothetical protein